MRSEPAAAETVQKAWVRLLRWIELARHYPMAYRLNSFGGVAARNPILEALLPLVLYVQLTSLLDEALDLVIEERGIPWPPKWKRDLYHRIELVAELLREKEQCHAIRERRRVLAHESDTSVTWPDLDAALDVVERELQALNLVGPRPKYEPFAERSAARAPRRPDGSFGFDYKVGLKEQDRVVVQYTWSTEVLKDDAE